MTLSDDDDDDISNSESSMIYANYYIRAHHWQYTSALKVNKKV